MKLWKVKNYISGGYDIACEIGQHTCWSYWSAPPESIDHADMGYIHERYGIITTEKRAKRFKELYKDLWVTKQTLERCKKANQLIETIASIDRRFFYCKSKDNLAKLEILEGNKVVIIDDYTMEKVDISKENREWPGFSHGGTLQRFIYALGQWVKGNKEFFYNMYSTAWAYTMDGMCGVVEKARELGMIPEDEETFKEFYEKQSSKGYVY